MTDCEPFDVLIALFPFVDLPQRKPRPVLVLSSEAFNAAHGHIVAAMITTGAGHQWPSDSIIADLGSAGRHHRSVVRWKIFTLPVAVVARRIGRFSETYQTNFASVFDPILRVPTAISASFDRTIREENRIADRSTDRRGSPRPDEVHSPPAQPDRCVNRPCRKVSHASPPTLR